jgi:hypothetical protein
MCGCRPAGFGSVCVVAPHLSHTSTGYMKLASDGGVLLSGNSAWLLALSVLFWGG